MYDSLLLFSFDDPGPHGTGRHMDHMLPEIPKEDFRKGAQVKETYLVICLYHTLKTHARSLTYSNIRNRFCVIVGAWNLSIRQKALK